MKTRLIIFCTLIFTVNAFAQIDRSVPPKPELPEKLKIGALIPVEMSNELQVYLAPVKGYPKFTISVNIQQPPISEEEREEEYRILNEAYMRKLSVNYPKGEIDSVTNFHAAMLSVTNSGGTIKGMKRDVDLLMGLFSDILLNPVIDDSVISTVANQYAIKKDKGTNTQPYSANRFSAEPIIDSIVFGLYSKAEKQERSLDFGNITREEVIDYHKSRIVANNTVVVIVGDFTPKECNRIIKEHLGEMPTGEKISFNEENEIKRSPLKNRRIIVVDEPTAVQSRIRFTWSLEDAFTFFEKSSELEVMNNIFGGSQMSYLYRNLREDKGLCYFIRSGIAADARGGRGEISTNVRTSETALAIENILFEMLRMRNTMVTEEDLWIAKNSLIGEFTRSLSGVTPIPYISLAMMKARYNLPDDYLSNKPAGYYKVTTRDIYEMANKYIKPFESLIIVTGKVSELEGTLEKFGDVTYLTSEGKEYPDISVR